MALQTLRYYPADIRLQWISWFLSSKGNEYFCEVEEEYILDRFNLTGLNTEVANYAQALDLITDNLGEVTWRCLGYSDLTRSR